ncbi:MAG TPA: M14 family metallopeptidase [Rhizomicrobium sp.]|nr:M14 family metallopeptidase [Rhizomicrobium sp.]
MSDEHFPPDYASARANFLKAARGADLGTTARVHPDAKTRDGKRLFLDTAVIGPREATTALLMISATHGVEGYFGSGVQTGMLREGLLEAPDGAKIVLLHALNPYGFAWDRRVNEDNADINRNFVDHGAPPANDAYAALAEWIAPRDMSREAMKAANAKLKLYADAHGDFALQEAITKGQYVYPDGLYYGGAKESWSSLMLRDVLREELRGVKRLVVIDFHTGLGRHGHGEMITEDLPGSPAYARAKAMWGERVCSSEAGESVSAPLTGTVDKAFAGWLPDAELTFAALEAGTLPTREVFNALRRDNWLHRFAGHDHESAEEIRREIRAAFYPGTPEWKRLVWASAVETVKQALNAL